MAVLTPALIIEREPYPLTAVEVGSLGDDISIVTGSEAGTVSLWTPSGRPLVSFSLDAVVNDIVIKNDDRLVCATNRGVATVKIRLGAGLA